MRFHTDVFPSFTIDLFSGVTKKFQSSLSFKNFDYYFIPISRALFLFILVLMLRNEFLLSFFHLPNLSHPSFVSHMRKDLLVDGDSFVRLLLF
jgi:hypothetical protein